MEWQNAKKWQAVLAMWIMDGVFMVLILGKLLNKMLNAIFPSVDVYVIKNHINHSYACN